MLVASDKRRTRRGAVLFATACKTRADERRDALASPDPEEASEASFRHHLYMGVVPMAPALGNDHAITPGASRSVYAGFSQMFRELRGSLWDFDSSVVVGHVGEIVANTFEVPEEDKIVVAIVALPGFENMNRSVSVDINITGDETACVTTYFGAGWKSATSVSSPEPGWARFSIEMVQGAAMLRCHVTRG